MRKILILAGMVSVVSLAYAFYFHDRPRVDALAYDKIGWNLARGLGYVEEEALSERPQDDWGINRLGPGYEFFLALIYSFFGHSIEIVWVLQALLRGLTVIIFYFLARALFPENNSIPFISSILFGFAPELIILTGLLLTETLFLFVFISALYFTVELVRHQKGSHALAAGFLWAFSILIRPTALLPLLVLIAYICWQRRWKLFFATLIPSLLLVGSWSIFATARYDRFILTTGVGAYDAWVGNNLFSTGGFEKTPDIQAIRNSGISSKELDRISKEKYFEFLRDHPRAFIKLQLRKTAVYFSLARPGGFWIALWDYPHQLFLTLIISFIWLAVVFVGGIAGIIEMFRKRRDLVTKFFVAFAFLQPASVIPIIVESRYRTPLFPFLILSAAYFYTARPFAKRALALSMAVFSVATLFDIIINFSYFLDKIHFIFS